MSTSKKGNAHNESAFACCYDVGVGVQAWEDRLENHPTTGWSEMLEKGVDPSSIVYMHRDACMFGDAWTHSNAPPHVHTTSENKDARLLFHT